MSKMDPIAFQAVVGLSLIGLAIVLFIKEPGSGFIGGLCIIIAVLSLLFGGAMLYPIITGESMTGATITTYLCPRCGTELGGAEYRQAMRKGYAICPECGETIRHHSSEIGYYSIGSEPPERVEKAEENLCPNCGAELEEEAIMFCPKCGVKIEEEEEI